MFLLTWLAHLSGQSLVPWLLKGKETLRATMAINFCAILGGKC